VSTGSVLLWFRSDLRVHDHGLLAQAAAKGHPVVALFVWEEAWMRTTRLGWPRMGAHRVRFLAETLADLRDQLAARGVPLRVRFGDPETIVAEEAARWEVQQVWAHTEPAWDEHGARLGRGATGEALGPEAAAARGVGAVFFRRHAASPR